jgi:phage portal protein BeeE
MSLLPTRWFGRKDGPVLVQSDGQKALSSMVFDGRGGSGFNIFSSLFSATSLLMNSSKVDWEKDVQDPLKSSVLMAPINWLMRTFPEAPLLVEAFNAEQKRWEPMVDSELLDLLDNPNPYYSGETLLMCTVLDVVFGEGYWLKLRNQDGKVVQLWWVPRAMMQPRYPSDGSMYISHFRYTVGSQGFDIPVNDVVYFRFGLDPRNPRRGLSQLGCLVREVAIDEHASNFTAAILKNLGIIGVIISPKVQGQGERAKTASADSVKAVKEYIMANFTGDRRGDPLAVGSPTEAQLLQYNMQGFDVGPIRDVSEERVCAAIGIPAAVVGFGTGLQQTKVGATMKEMRQLAWISGVIPLQRIVANEIRRSLLPEFVPGARRSTHRMRFDSAAVPLLWETPTEKHNRIRDDFKAQMIKRSEARLETGRAAGKEDEVYVRSNNADPKANPVTPADEPGKEQE